MTLPRRGGGHISYGLTNSFTGAYRSAISGDLLSAVISIRYIFGFRKDNPNVFNGLIQSWLHF
jgi:hypothetical protein